MLNLKEEILKEFDEKFPRMFAGSAGQYDKDGEIRPYYNDEVKNWLSFKLDEIEKEVILLLPEERKTPLLNDFQDGYTNGYNSAIQTIRERITKYFL